MSAVPPSDDPIRSLRILVVEDQLATRGWICDMLRALNVRAILTASDGHEALTLVKDRGEEVDLILCDWAMPKMTGIDFLRRVRQFRPDLPFIMETGHGTADAVLEARSEGVSAFIVKPFSQAQLEAKMRVVLSQSARARRR